MCYTGGPRCSPHARQALAKAEASGDKDLIKTARQDYYLTPAGIAKARQAGKADMADKLQAKRSEILTYETKDPYIPVAECRMETDYSVVTEGMDVLVMEKVDIQGVSHLGYKDMPDWVGSVDCAQVGYDRKGLLVAYDL